MTVVFKNRGRFPSAPGKGGLCGISECQNVHQNDVDCQHNDGHRQLGEDNGILALGLQQRCRHNVEIGSHGGHQGAAVTGSQAQRANHHRIRALCNDEGNADADGDHGEGCEAVAHNHGEQSHGDAVDSNSGQLVALGNHHANAGSDDIANTGCGEQSAQSGQDLGQQTHGANIVQQTGAVSQGGSRLCLEQAQGHDQSHQSGNADGVVGTQSLPEGSHQNSGQRQGHGRNKDLKAVLVGIATGLLGRGDIGSGLLDLPGSSQAGHSHHADAGDPLGDVGAGHEGKGNDEPESSGGDPGLQAGVLQSLHAVQSKQCADDAVENFSNDGAQSPGHNYLPPFPAYLRFIPASKISA